MTRVELLVAHPHEQLSRVMPGVGHEDLHRAAEELLGLGEGRVDRGRVGHLADDALQPLGRLPRAVGDDDVVAGLGEGPWRCTARCPRLPPVTSTLRPAMRSPPCSKGARSPAGGACRDPTDYRWVHRIAGGLSWTCAARSRHQRHDEPVVQSVTSAPESLADEQAGRIRRYLFTMGIRTACFVGAVVTASWVRRVGVGHPGRGRDLLPYVAVVLANAVRPAAPGVVSAPVTPARRRHQPDRPLMEALVCSAKGCRSGRGLGPPVEQPQAAHRGPPQGLAGLRRAPGQPRRVPLGARLPHRDGRPPGRSPRPLAEPRRAGLDPAGPPS